MSVGLAYLAGAGGSICYGLATVLEHHEVKKNQQIDKIRYSSVAGLIKKLPFIEGIALDILGWLLFVYSLWVLPVFLVQSFIASSLVVSALIDWHWFKSRITNFEKLSIAAVLAGVVILGFVAEPGRATAVNKIFEWTIIIGPAVVLICALVAMRSKVSRYSSITISLLSGLAFGGTSVVARILSYGHFHLNPLTIILMIEFALYGVIAMFLLSVALQREKLNRVNCALFASEIIVPSIFGLIFLGDKIRNGLEWALVLGLVLLIIGTVITAFDIDN